MSTTIYAGDVAFEITFPMAVVSMSGATVTSARLMVTRPDGTSITTSVTPTDPRRLARW